MERQEPHRASALHATLLNGAASLAPGLVLLMLAFVAVEAGEFLVRQGPAETLSASWKPPAGQYGMVGLVLSSLVLACGAAVLSVLVGTPAAVRLALFAGPAEARVARAALGLMAGLPSIIVGLVGLAWVTPITGYTLIAGLGTLFLMIFPTYVLLAAAALELEAAQRRPTCRALGLTDRDFAYRVALRAVLPALAAAGALALGKGLGEATAVSLVIGNVTGHSGGTALPGLFEPASTLTSVILKDHGGATGLHRGALFAAALWLAVLVVAIHAAGSWLAELLRRRLGP
jgi:phosphate transport system permease protein